MAGAAPVLGGHMDPARPRDGRRQARRRGEAALLLEETRTIAAAAAGATTFVMNAQRLTRSFDLAGQQTRGIR